MKAVLGFSILALTSTGLFGCVSESSSDGDSGSGGSGSTTDTSATSTSTTDTSATSTSTTGSGGSGECVVMTTPLIGDFEGYDGAMDAVDYTWSFNEDGLGFGGFWLHTDEADENGDVPSGGGYSLTFIAGSGSTYAISGQDTEADMWGGGIAIYTSCLDASAYTGIQFMAKGSTPAGTFNLSIATEGEQGFSSSNLTTPDDWEQLQVSFASMSADEGTTATSTNGTGILAIVFNSHLIWVEDDSGNWNPTPGPFELTIDDLSFY